LWFSPDGQSWEYYDTEIQNAELILTPKNEELLSKVMVDLSKVTGVENGEKSGDKYVFRLIPNSQFFATDTVYERLGWIQQIEKFTDIYTVPRSCSDPNFFQSSGVLDHNTRIKHSSISPTNSEAGTNESNIEYRKNSLALFKPKSLDNFVKITRDYCNPKPSNKVPQLPVGNRGSMIMEPKREFHELKSRSEKASKKHHSEDEEKSVRKSRVSISEGTKNSRCISPKSDTENINPNLSTSCGSTEPESRSPKYRTTALRRKAPSEVIKSNNPRPLGKVKRTSSNNKAHESREINCFKTSRM